MATQVQTLNYIGGEFRAARSGAVDEVLDPATGEVIAEVASSDAADAADAVEACWPSSPGGRPHPAVGVFRC